MDDRELKKRLAEMAGVSVEELQARFEACKETLPDLSENAKRAAHESARKYLDFVVGMVMALYSAGHEPESVMFYLDLLQHHPGTSGIVADPCTRVLLLAGFRRTQQDLEVAMSGFSV